MQNPPKTGASETRLPAAKAKGEDGATSAAGCQCFLGFGDFADEGMYEQVVDQAVPKQLEQGVTVTDVFECVV